MLSKRRGVWGAGVGVVLAAGSGALINELQAGWPWWVAAALVVLASAVLAGWLAAGGESADNGQRTADDQPGRGAVPLFGAGRDIKIGRNVKAQGAPAPDHNVQLFSAGRDIDVGGDVDITGTDKDNRR